MFPLSPVLILQECKLRMRPSSFTFVKSAIKQPTMTWETTKQYFSLVRNFPSGSKCLSMACVRKTCQVWTTRSSLFLKNKFLVFNSTISCRPTTMMSGYCLSVAGQPALNIGTISWKFFGVLPAQFMVNIAMFRSCVFAESRSNTAFCCIGRSDFKMASSSRALLCDCSSGLETMGLNWVIVSKQYCLFWSLRFC